MREPSPSAIVGGIAEHMLPFAAVAAELWRVLMERFMSELERMRAADLDLMDTRPDRLDTKPDRDTLYAQVRERTRTLSDDFNRAVDLPRGWFAWSPAARRRLAAIDRAAAAEKAWSTEGSIKYLKREAGRLDSAVRRQDKRIRDFDMRPEVQMAARRLDDYPSATRMVEGLAELEPDKELHGVLAPVVGRDGQVIRLNAAAGLELLRRRSAIAAASRGAAAGKGTRRQVVEMVPDEVDGPDDRPEVGDDDVGPVTGLML